jgi:hypothetical protein
MHISITVPNPLARLTRILAALERGRVGGDLHAPDWRDEVREETQADYSYDLDSLSLSHCELPRERRCDNREFLSRSCLEWTEPGQHDDLSDLSLERNFPPWTGP